MDVSSSTTSSTNTQAQQAQSTGQDALKKAEEVQERQIEKTLESVNEQTQKTNAQKTGIGNDVNLTA